MRARRTGIVWALAILVIGTGLAGCGSSGSSGGGASGSATSIKLGYHAPSEAVWPLWIAQETGKLKQQGINASLVFAEGNRVVQGVIAGATPIAFASGNDLLAPAAQGADLVALMSSGGERPGSEIWGGPNTKAAADLKGKVAGANELGGEADRLLKFGLGKMGLTPGKDVQTVAVGEQTARIAALKAGRIQAAIMDPGFEKQLQGYGFHLLYDFNKGPLRLQKGTLITTRSYLDKNRATVDRVVAAMLEGVAYERKNEQGTIAIAQKYEAGVDKSVLSTVWQRFVPELPAVPRVQPKALDSIKIFTSDPKVRGFDVSKMIDDGPLNRAAQQQGLR